MNRETSNQLFKQIMRIFDDYEAGGEDAALQQSTLLNLNAQAELPCLNSRDAQQQAIKQIFAELRQVGATLRESETRFRVLSEMTPVGIFETDATGRCLYVNERWRQIFDGTAAESSGESWVRSVHPEEQTEVLKAWAAYVQTGEELAQEFRVVTPCGDVRWVAMRARPVRAHNGAIRGHIRTAEDMTERKEREAWLQGLFTSTQDALIAIDRQSRIVLFTPAAEKAFGYTPEEAVGQTMRLLMPEPDARELDAYIERCERMGEWRALDRLHTVMARRKNGELFPIEMFLAEVKIGGSVHYSACIRDISEKVQLQERLMEKERLAAIGMTAAKLAHEITNPLSGMSLAVQLLEAQFGNPQEEEDVRSSLCTLKSQIMRLFHLLREFLSFSRRQHLTLQPTDIRDLVHEVLSVDLSLHDGQGIMTEKLFAADLPLVEVDREKFKQVVLNLCKNAVEAMPEGGVLTVRVQNSGDLAHVEIADTGVGLPLDVDIFEPFMTTKEGGTGLGLSVVRQLVEAHGGALNYTSEPGRGTTFVLALPLWMSKETQHQPA